MNDINIKKSSDIFYYKIKKTKTYVNILQITIKICIMTKKDKQLKVLHEV